LFAATPFAIGPVALKQQIAHALEADGVPVSTSVHGSAHDASPDTIPVAEAAPEGAQGLRHNRRRLVAAAVAAGVLVVAVVIVAFAGSLDHGTLDDQRIESEGALHTTIASSASSTTKPAPTAASTVTATSAQLPTSPIAPGDPTPPLVVPPATPPDTPPATSPPAPPTTPPPSAPPANASAAISPATVTTPPPYTRPAAPVLTWTTSGGTSVSVVGPGVSSSAVSGSVPLCPNASSAVWSICEPPNGTYTYIVTVRDGAGVVLDSATATLTAL
jgi:hypothetical protein